MCIPACTVADTPQGRHPPGRPPTPWADTPRQTPPGRHPQADPLDRHPPVQCMLGYTPLPSACWNAHTPYPVHAEIHTPCPVHAGIHTPLLSACWDTAPHPQRSNRSGRYTSYWKAFLFLCFSAHVKFIQRGTLENSCFLWPI